MRLIRRTITLMAVIALIITGIIVAPQEAEAAGAKYSIGKVSVTVPSERVYSGKAYKPSRIVVKNTSGKVLKEGVDYRLSVKGSRDSYYKSVNAADYVNAGKVSIMVTGMGNYTHKTKYVSYTISPATLTSSNAKVFLSGEALGQTPSFTYIHGGIAPSQPKVLWTKGRRYLTKGTDFVVLYSNNTKAGTARATIYGIGNFKGSVKKTFIIKRASITSGLVSKNFKKTAYLKNGEATPGFSMSTSVETFYRLQEGVDYTITYRNNTKVGTATAIVKGKGNYIGTYTFYFKVKKK